MARRIESLFLDGPAGRLEAILEEPEAGAPREVALVCHPHPQYGGTMHNKVVYRMARALRHAGAVALRFNYRGVNLSAGAYAHGEGELDDARTALAWLRQRYPELPVTLAGFSFGSRIVLRLACECPEARRVIAVGFPADSYAATTDLSRCLVPKLFVHGTHDQFGSVDAIRAFAGSVPAPKALHLVEAQDHFFAGALDEFENVVRNLA